MARILERELYDRLFKPHHRIVIFAPGMFPDIDSTPLYLCKKNAHPNGRVILVDSQIGDPHEIREEPCMAEHFEKAKELKLESGGEGNARRHLQEILAFKARNPKLQIKTPKIQWASAFDTKLESDSADRTLNRGGLYWMTFQGRDNRTVRDAIDENLRILKPGGIGVILNGEELLPDRDITGKIRFALQRLKVPFEEFEILPGLFHIGNRFFEPAYKYGKAFKFTKPQKTGN